MSITLKQAGSSEIPSTTNILIASHTSAKLTELSLQAPNTLTIAVGACKPVLALAGAMYVEVTDEESLYAVKVALDGTPEERKERFGFDIETIVINTVDGLQRVLLDNRLRENRRLNIENDDWNWITSRLHAIFGGLSELGLNLVVLSHLSNIGESSAVKPNIIGNFNSQIHDYVDYAFWLDTYETRSVEGIEEPIETIERGWTLRTRPDGNAPWIHDDTQSVDEPFLDLTEGNLFAILAGARDCISVSASSSIEIDDPTEVTEEVTEIVEPNEETAEPAPENAEVPGMSSDDEVQDKIKNILKKK